MALINCPECGKEKVSDSAITCPYCGFGIADYYKRKEEEEKRKRQNEQQRQKMLQQEEIAAERKKRFQKNKKKYIIISLVSIALLAAIICSSIFLYNKAQIKTFNSAEEMKSYVEGVYTYEYNDLLNYRLTVKDDYIILERYGEMNRGFGQVDRFDSEEEKYHISEYDYNNGVIHTDKTYRTITEGSGLSAQKKKEEYDIHNEFTVKAEKVIENNKRIYRSND